MKKKNSKLHRFSSAVLALFLCMVLMPLSTFAENELPAGDQQAAQQIEEEAAPVQEEAPAEETAPAQTEEPQAEEVQMAAPGSEDCQHELVTVEETQATCQHTGLKAHRECTKCGAAFDLIDNRMLTDEEYNALVIPIADHKWDAGTVIRQATASAPGIKRYTCSVCGVTTDEEIIYVPKPVVGKSFKLNGYTLNFKKNEVKTVPAFMKDARIGRTWIKAGKKKLTVRWKKFSKSQLKKIDGMYIELATDKNFTQNFKVVKVSKKTLKKGYKSIKKLKGGKKYYVRMYTYKKIKQGGENFYMYSDYSKTKVRKTRK